MMSEVAPVNLLGQSREALVQFFETLGEKPFRATQVLKWIHQMGVTDFQEMTNLSKALRMKLEAHAIVQPLEVYFDHISEDGTRKWLMGVSEANKVETVFIPEPGRGTLCVSSQIGCALNCQFCATATMGFNRNLTTAEIIGQVWHAVKTLEADGNEHRVTNVVLMGMGEPLMNYDNVLPATELMMDDLAYGLSKYRVTLSTSGVLPNLKRLSAESDVALAVSLHATNDVLRNELVPINKKYPLKELMAVCRDYFPKNSKRFITFEYVMLKDVNDSPQQAKELVGLLNGVRGKVNLIPFNPFKRARYTCSSPETILKFQAILKKAGLIATVRKTRGDDIAAACGQLIGDFKDKTKRSELYRRRFEQESLAN